MSEPSSSFDPFDPKNVDKFFQRRRQQAALLDAAQSLLEVCEAYIDYREGNDGNIDEIAARMKRAIKRAKGLAKRT